MSLHPSSSVTHSKKTDIVVVIYIYTCIHVMFLYEKTETVRLDLMKITCYTCEINRFTRKTQQKQVSMYKNVALHTTTQIVVGECL